MDPTIDRMTISNIKKQENFYLLLKPVGLAGFFPDGFCLRKWYDLGS